MSDVTFSDADMLIRHCEFPAMRRDPLQRIMFPKTGTSAKEEEEEEIRWRVEGLEESLAKESCYFRKVTTESGGYAGFAMWTLESDREGLKLKTESRMKRESWNPALLDVTAWKEISQRLRQERQSVLQGQQNIFRKSDYQYSRDGLP